MVQPSFFDPPKSMRLEEIASLAGAELVRGKSDCEITGVAPLHQADRGDLTFLENLKYLGDLGNLQATACLCKPMYVDKIPESVAVLQTDAPYRSYAAVLSTLYPDAVRPNSVFEGGGDLSVDKRAHVHPTAILEDPVGIGPGAVVGAGVRIGRGTTINAGSVVAAGVSIGRNCSIGPNVTLQHALIGDRVIVHPGTQIGQDGFGIAPGASGHLKVPQIGRVIIQDDVEIGANCCVDRGSNRDTYLGEGTKIDNLVQIAHNVVIGRHCIIVGQVGISGSVTLGDFVAIGGKTGINGHVTIGDGANIAAVSVVRGDVPPGARWGGVPARAVDRWFRDTKIMDRLIRREDQMSRERRNKGNDNQSEPGS